MNAMWSEAKARVSHRLAMHLRVDRFRLLNDTPMVSFTFDDLPKSAATTGAATGDAEDIMALHHRGHEIACHTFSHKRACDLDAASLAEEIERNRQYFRAIDPSIKVENFPYPWGYGSLVRKQQLRTVFQSCRSIVPGVNSGTVDLQFLRAMPLIDRRIDCERIERAFDEAQTNNGWLIFYTHDVADRPSPYGCSPALMNHALEAASRRKIPILNMAEALRCAGA